MRFLRILAVLALASTLAVVTPTAAQATPDHYTPWAGVRFNNPYPGLSYPKAIWNEIVRSINSTPKGQSIHISAWNLRSPVIANALIAAHKRGVVVQVIMDLANATVGHPNRDAARVQAALRQGNSKLPAAQRSWLRKCSGSCRGTRGIPHAKFYLFSRVQKTPDIVMFGSNNATDLAASIQWNDQYTFVNRPDIYAAFLTIFKQMSWDKPFKAGAYRVYNFGNFTAYFYPYTGPAAVGDPDLTRLRNVTCTGATGHTGYQGHTKIRIAQTATYGARGIALAKQLAKMEKQGCNIRIVYAMFGSNVIKILKAAKVPMTHLAWDANGDGIYDRYLHMKSMAISGVYNGVTNATVTFDGSSNWTSVSLASDEIVGEFDSPGITVKYINWIDYLFHHRPPSWTSNTQATAEARLAKKSGVDPYKLIKQDL